MKVVFLDVESGKKVYREYNGGYGTSFNAGRSFLGRILTGKRTKNEHFPYMPYAYGATIMRNNGHEVLISNNVSNADLVIMHASMPNHSNEINYLRKLKERGIKVGVIGPFAGMKLELFGDAEFIIKGDVENVLSKIKSIKDIPKGVVNLPITNLDDLPYPDWSLYSYEKFSYSPIINKKPFTFVLSSRGCTYGCNYCPYISESNLGSKYRMRSVANVVNELKYLQDKFGIKGVQFRDPLFTLIRKRTEDLCNEIIKEKMIKYCEKIGMRVVGFYVIGLENDTEETVKATLKYSRKLNTDFANFTICTPIPGTEFYDIIKDRITTEDYDLYDNFHVTFDHPNLSEEEIMKYQEKAFVGYYLRPRYIYKYITKTLFI